MKLYTEEQIIQIVYWMSPTYMGREQVEQQIKKELTPIELPSDEDIEQEAYYKVSDHTENPYASFKSGANWLKQQILNQNKG